MFVEQVVSTVKKPNHSPQQTTKVRSHCYDIQRFLLSLLQVFLPTHGQGKLKIQKKIEKLIIVSPHLLDT